MVYPRTCPVYRLGFATNVSGVWFLALFAQRGAPACMRANLRGARLMLLQPLGVSRVIGLAVRVVQLGQRSRHV